LRAIGLLFQRAAPGDGYERAVAGEWQALTAIMRPLTRDQRAGCCRWAAFPEECGFSPLVPHGR
jgi:hypothetical protein